MSKREVGTSCLLLVDPLLKEVGTRQLTVLVGVRALEV